MQPFQPRLIDHTGMSVLLDFVRDGLSADPRNRRFTGGIDIRNDDAVGVIEGRAKFFSQSFGAGIPVRLKHDS